MKKFKKDGKINFVDEFNVLVGYDIGQDCCEHADWFISDMEENTVYDKNYNSIKRPEFDINKYRFDKKYFEKVECSQLDEGGMVRFKLTAKGLSNLYLHLFNSQNGYYGHGFEANIDGLKWQEDIL
uniref:Uncharacterized protein n=1 Tax=viral metagenome TaxID=1070528 RepID=A0A6M3KJA1_9ZZZZ